MAANINIKISGEDEILSVFKKLGDQEKKRSDELKNTNQQYQKLSANMSQLKEKLTALEAAKERSFNPIAIDRFNAKIKETQNELKKISGVNIKPNLPALLPPTNPAKNEIGTLANLASGFGKTMIAAFAVGKVVEYGKEILETRMKMQALENSIKFISKTSEEYDKNMKFLRDTSQKLGLDLESASKGFKTIAGAALPAGISADQVRGSFEAVAKASTVMGLSAQDSEGVFLALGQMISKGTVQAEELRGQLGERLPGAFNIAANAMGVTTAQLNKMLEQGQVVSKDFLPKFTAELNKVYSSGVAANADSLSANFNRMNTAITELVNSVGDKMSNAFNFGLKGITAMTNGLREFISPAKSVEEQVKKEQLEVNKLVLQITSLNQDNKERGTLLAKLNAEYPFFLKNLNQETVTNAQLLDHLDKINKAYVHRILLKKEEKTFEKLGQATAEQLENERNLRQELIGVMAEAQQKGLLSQNQVRAFTKGLGEDGQVTADILRNLGLASEFARKKSYDYTNAMLGEATSTMGSYLFGSQKLTNLKEQSKAYQRLYENITNLADGILEADNLQERGNMKMSESQKRLAIERAKIEAQLFVNPERNQKAFAEVTDAQKKALDKLAKQNAELMARELEAQQLQKIATIENQIKLNENIVSNEENSANDRIDALQENEALYTRLYSANLDAQLKKYEVNEQNQVIIKRLTATEKINIEADTLTKLQQQTFELYQKIQKIRADDIAKQKQEALNKLEIEKTFALEKTNENESKNLITAMQKVSALENASLYERKQGFKKFQEDKTQISLYYEQLRLSTQLQYLEEELKIIGNSDLSKKAQIESAIVKNKEKSEELKLQATEKRIQSEIKLEEERLAQVRAIEEKALELGTTVAGALFDNKSQQMTAEMEQLQAQKENELRLAGDNEQKKNFIQSQFAQKERAIKIQQAKAEKDRAIFEILLQTGINTVRAFGTPPVPNFVLAGITAGIGLVQVASVSARPLPKYRKGIENLQVGLSGMDSDGLLIEAHRGERIVPSALNAMLGNIPNSLLPILVNKGLNDSNGLNEQVIQNAFEKSLQKLNLTSVNFNEKGFSEYMVSKNLELKKLNADYEF